MSAIASKTFGIWYGLMGAEASDQMDGSLVLGGYDVAKITGGSYTDALGPPYPGCSSGILATVADINMELLNGGSISIIQEGLTQKNVYSALVSIDHSTRGSLEQVSGQRRRNTAWTFIRN